MHPAAHAAPAVHCSCPSPRESCVALLSPLRHNNCNPTSTTSNPRLQAMPHEPVTVYTVGHSNRPLQELIGLLHEHGVATLVDVSVSTVASTATPVPPLPLPLPLPPMPPACQRRHCGLFSKSTLLACWRRCALRRAPALIHSSTKTRWSTRCQRGTAVSMSGWAGSWGGSASGTKAWRPTAAGKTTHSEVGGCGSGRARDT
jgi:hypothetical protein